MKEKVIIYGLGKCWDDNWKEIIKDYEVVCCVDRNVDQEKNAKGFMFCEPRQITQYEYDKLIICIYETSKAIREEIILLWDIPTEKIYYYQELYGHYCGRPEKWCITSGNKLTVVIPTYNRKKRLARTLDLLERQTYKDFQVIILDNVSDYNISEILEGRGQEFKNRVEIRKNNGNVGMCGNLAMSFLQADEGWMWTLSDDDIPSVYAVEVIMQEVEKNKDVGAFMFSIYEIGMHMDGDAQYINSFAELTRFYKRFKEIERLNLNGDFIFFSNKVYNMSRIKKYMEKVFTYSYTGVPQLMPFLFMLDEQASTVIISNKKIVAYSLPEGRDWDRIKIGLGMSTITDLPLISADCEDKKMLYRLIMISPQAMLTVTEEAVTDENIKVFEKLYDKIYKIYLNKEEGREYLARIASMRLLLSDSIAKEGVHNG